MSPGVTFLLKWLVVPIAVAATGYFVVGPRVGGPVAERAAKKIKRSGIAQHIAPITTTQPRAAAGTGDDVITDPDPGVKPNRQDEPRSKSTAAGPQISVAVTPANSSGNDGATLESRPADDSAAPPKRKRRHRSAATTTQPAPPREKSADPGPTEDPAGVGAGVP